MKKTSKQKTKHSSTSSVINMKLSQMSKTYIKQNAKMVSSFLILWEWPQVSLLEIVNDKFIKKYAEAYKISDGYK